MKDRPGRRPPATASLASRRLPRAFWGGSGDRWTTADDGAVALWSLVAGVVVVLAVLAGIVLLSWNGGDQGTGTTGASTPSGSGATGGSPAPAGGGEVKVVKIGALYPLTGDLALLGRDNLDGLELAVDEINRTGGIASLGGAKLQVVEADSQGRPEIGVTEVDRLVQQDGVSALVGAYQSRVTVPAAEEAEKRKTPFIVNTAVADEITQLGLTYTFRICPPAAWYARDQVQFLLDLPRAGGPTIKRVALLHGDSEFGTSTAAQQKTYLQAAGIAVTAEVTYPAGATDLTKQVSTVKASAPDAVLTVTFLDDALLIAQARRTLGMRQLFFDAAGGTVDAEYLKRAAGSAEGMLTELEYTKFGRGAMGLNDRFRQRYGRDISGNAAYAYQAGYVLADALQRAAAAAPAGLRQALATTNMPPSPRMVLPTPALEFGPDGQNKSARLFVVQVQKGQLVPVWPLEFAAAKVVVAP